MKIDTGDHAPIKCQPNRASPVEQQKIMELAEDMKKDGIAEDSKSPWAFPVVLVKKKDGTYRFCVDYRKLNAITKKDSYALPRIDDTLDAIGTKNKFYSVLDIASGFWNVIVEDVDKEKLAFVARGVHMQFTVMPFGLSNAPATFHRIIDETLRDLLFKCCLVFVDDIVVFSKDFEEHKLHLAAVFDRLLENGFTLKLSKCMFFSDTVSYLGYVIREGSITVDAKKVEAIANFKYPSSIKGLQRYLGMVSWYRKMIPNFSDIAAPLFELLKKDDIPKWEIDIPGTKQNEAFENVRNALMTYPILRLPDFEKPFIIICDASKNAVGGVLVQNQDGLEHPIAYMSKAHLLKNEHSYEQETYALVTCLKAFYHYVHGSAFTVITDCRALSYFNSPKQRLSPKVERWLSVIQSFDITFIHRAGKLIVTSDALSRDERYNPLEVNGRHKYKLGAINIVNIYLNEKSETDKNAGEKADGAEADKAEADKLKKSIDAIKPELVSLPANATDTLKLGAKSISSAQQNNRYSLQLYDFLDKRKLPVDKKERKRIKKEAEGLGLVNGIICKLPDIGSFGASCPLIPPDLREPIMKAYHDDILAGHQGVTRTQQRIGSRYYWPNMNSDIATYVGKCPSCSMNKKLGNPRRTTLQPLKLIAPWHVVQMDYVGPFKITANGNEYILVMVDAFSKHVELFACDAADSVNAVLGFQKHILFRWGTPKVVMTDDGSHFKAVFKEYLEQLGIYHDKSLPHNHNTCGLVERMNRTVEEIIRHYVNQKFNNWDDLLQKNSVCHQHRCSKIHWIFPIWCFMRL